LQLGGNPQWKPQRLAHAFRGIVDGSTLTLKLCAFVFTAGDYLPPYTPRVLRLRCRIGRKSSLAENFGGIVTARLATAHWSLARSRSIQRGIAVSYENCPSTRCPMAREQVSLSIQIKGPPRPSGEARLVGRVERLLGATILYPRPLSRQNRGALRRVHAVTWSAFIAQGNSGSSARFSYTRAYQRSHRTLDRLCAYRAQWQGHGDFAVGHSARELRRSFLFGPAYSAPDRCNPLRATETHAGPWPNATAYAWLYPGPQGSGAVPQRGPPTAARFSLLPCRANLAGDVGVSSSVTPSQKLQLDRRRVRIESRIYFDSNQRRSPLGVQRARGVELSCLESFVPNLLLPWRVIGEGPIRDPSEAARRRWNYRVWPPNNQGSDQRPISHVPSGGYRRSPLISRSWSWYRHPQALHVAQIATETWLAVVGRYPVQVWVAPSTAARGSPECCQFLFGMTATGPDFSHIQPRAYFAYLTADIEF